MSSELSKVQQEAIEKLRSGALNMLHRRELLRAAAEKGWADVLQAAIDMGESSKVRFDRLLHRASFWENDHAEVVAVLLGAGADPNADAAMCYCGVKSLTLLAREPQKGTGPFIVSVLNESV